MSRVIHFEIRVDSPRRAIKFYTEVFGWKIDQWKGPQGPIDFWLVTTGKEPEPGIDGALAPRGHHPEPTVNTISVPSIDEYMAKIKAAGGQVLTPKMPIPTIGWFATCKDSEGNTFGIMQSDPKAH